MWAARLEGGEGCQASRRPHRDLLGLTAPRSLQVGPPGPRPTGRCARGPWHKALPGPRCCCCRPPSVRPEEPPSHRCCCSFDSCCEEWDSWPGKQKWFSFFFFFLYKWKENPGEAAPLPSPQSVMRYRCFNFLVTVFVFGPGTTPQILLVLTQGVFASPDRKSVV